MTTDETDELVKKHVSLTTLTLPGYTQLLPRAKLHYEYETKKLIKLVCKIQAQYHYQKVNPKDLD